MTRASSAGTKHAMCGVTSTNPALGSRAPSSLSQRAKERTTSHGETSAEFPRLARRMFLSFPRVLQWLIVFLGPMSRTPSTHTITQVPASPRTPMERHSSIAQRARSREAPGRSIEASPKQQYQQQRPYHKEASPAAVASDSSSSSSSSDDAPQPMTHSRVFARRPRYTSSKAPLNPLSDADEEDEDSPPFLPFSDTHRPITPPPPPAPTTTTDPSSTLKIAATKRPPPSHHHHHRHHRPPSAPPHVPPKKAPQPQTAHSSSSSVQSQPQQPNRPPLSTLSPRQRRIAKDAREGSEGTPSMGSSFSDLDDASVTQSALEEALANEMNHGGSVVSRMSTISQALRSRYL